jgi:hypothetical protein
VFNTRLSGLPGNDDAGTSNLNSRLIARFSWCLYSLDDVGACPDCRTVSLPDPAACVSRNSMDCHKLTNSSAELSPSEPFYSERNSRRKTCIDYAFTWLMFSGARIGFRMISLQVVKRWRLTLEANLATGGLVKMIFPPA